MSGGPDVELLERLGLDSSGTTIEPLSGGVSSDIWLIKTGEGSAVLKSPRQRLKVAADWQAPLSRGASEAAWLDYVASAVPGACPRVIAYDPTTYSILLEYLDPSVDRNWKSLLMAGDVDVTFAGSVGRTDLPGADWQTLLDSIRALVDRLPAETAVYPGHGPATTLAAELASNPFLGELRLGSPDPTG